MTKSSNSNEKTKYQLENHENRIKSIETKIDGVERTLVEVKTELKFITKAIEDLKNTIKSNNNKTIGWAAIWIPVGWGVLYFIFDLILKLIKHG